MPFDIGTLGMGAAAGAINTSLDIATAGIRRNQQLKTQKKSLEQQNAAAMDIWEKTGYGAQKKQMQEAGINPGLLYGMSGGGAQTTGSSGGQVPEAQTKAYGMDIAGAAQLRLIQAQAAKLEAETNNLKAGTGKIGVEIPKIQQDTETAKAHQLQIESSTRLQELENEFKTRSMEDNLMTVRQNLQKLGEEAQKLLDEGAVRGANWEEYMAGVKAEWAGKLIENESKRMGIALDATKINEINTMLKVNVFKAQLDATGKRIDQEKLMLDRWIHDISDKTKIPVELVGSILKGIILVR